MFQKIFNPDNALIITLSQITDCIFLSLFWVLGCVPVVTVGASFAALYDAVYRTFRKGEKHAWHRFLHTFRQNWAAGILPTIVFGVVFLGAGKLLIQVWNAAVAGSISWMLFSGAALIGVLLLGVLSVLFPMLSRFENSLGSLLKNTVLLALSKMPLTLGLGILNAVSIFLCVRFVFPLFFLPALAALLGSLFIEPMFKPYMPEEAPEDAA
ncbi:MAG: YesL family protein [Oscillospiraceae bacterium]|nr:YesL family protein [Oscillospiraceae bacterium]